MVDTQDEIPDYAERSRRMGDLIAAPALPVADVALFLDVPLSTLRSMKPTLADAESALVSRIPPSGTHFAASGER
jgi:hypothetical protein